MTRLRGVTFGLLASTALASSPALAQSTVSPADATPQSPTTQSPAPGTNATSVTSSPAVQQAQDGQVPDETEIIVTAQKREENLQDVPISVQAIGTRRLDQLNISNFEDYTKQLPSVSFQTIQPGSTTVYMRGVATGGDGNHSGSFPSVGFYLDEQPITTIGGTLDVHIYDIARIESLAGPQGTLYGASSQAGTIRIITNKPELGVTTGRIDGELNKVAHGDMGGALEGMINLPLGERMAFRASAFYQRDGGYIDNVAGSRTYCGDAVFGPDGDDDDSDPDIVGCVRNGFTIDNDEFVENNFNDVRTYGGRAALKIDLDDNWTVTPTIMHQNSKTDGVFYYERPLGDLNTRRFRDEPTRDKFTQVALTIEGKIFNFDVTYAGAYLKRPTYGISDYSEYTAVYDDYYETYGGLANYAYFFDNAGNAIDPTQYIVGTNNFKKMSQEVRVASPQDRPFRVIAGAFYQKQTNDIFQDYRVDNLADDLSVNGSPGSLWLTKQERVDKDYALFGEASFDVTPQITLTGGGRLYKYNNSLFGFAGFGRNPNYDMNDPNETDPPNVVGSTGTGVAECFAADGVLIEEGGTGGFAPGSISGIPCTNVGVFKNGRVRPKRVKDSGITHRLNAQYKPHDNMMFYATWSRGFRPGGINRRAALQPYDADFLTNYELGWKTTLGPVRWNGAIYRQRWEKFQFSFLGENSLTVIQNGRDAKISGIETDVNYTASGLTLNAAAAYTNAKTKGNICEAVDDDADCSETFVVTRSGSRLPVTPKFKMSTTARYAWPMGPGRAHVQGALSYQGSALADIRRDISGGDEPTDPNDFLGRIRAATIVDLYTGYSFRNYNFELFGTNVFDKRNDLSRFVVCSVCTATKIVPGRPRTIGIRAGVKF
jgi:outer membrane receptor protein involved in Fe transport